jgi:hypothetical protein
VPGRSEDRTGRKATKEGGEQKMINQMRVTNATGAVALATTLAPARDFRLSEIRIHLSKAGGGGNFTATVDSATGAAYDINLITQDMTIVTDLIWQPEHPIQFFVGDEIDFAWANAGAATYGMTVIWEAI